MGLCGPSKLESEQFCPYVENEMNFMVDFNFYIYAQRIYVSTRDYLSGARSVTSTIPGIFWPPTEWSFRHVSCRQTAPCRERSQVPPLKEVMILHPHPSPSSAASPRCYHILRSDLRADAPFSHCPWESWSPASVPCAPFLPASCHLASFIHLA